MNNYVSVVVVASLEN